MDMQNGKVPVQAEDGIRDPLWSRGLGDVYKRQTIRDAGKPAFTSVGTRSEITFSVAVRSRT